MYIFVKKSERCNILIFGISSIQPQNTKLRENVRLKLNSFGDLTQDDP